MTRLCTKCKTTKPIEDFYTKSKSGKTYHWCRRCMSQVTIDKHRAFKLKALEYKGNKCQICGYNKCIRSLTFHHIDPNEKEFGIARDTSRNWSKIQKELDKCMLLCQNCHGELHDGLIQLP